VLLIALLLLVMAFFRADDLVGAVGLREVYRNPILVLLISFLVSAIVLLYLYKIEKLNFSIVMLLLLALLSLSIIFGTMPFTCLGSIIVFVLCQPVPLLLGSLFATATQVTKRVILPKVVISGVLLLTVTLMMSISGTESATGNLKGHLQVGDKQYFLEVRMGLMDPDSVILYECNSIALFCHIVHSADGVYVGKEVALQYDSGMEILEIILEKEIIYTYKVPS
jgi:hypothetical protein